MKLGEALTLRSQLQTRFQLLQGRLKVSVLVQEGESPPEDPNELLEELDEVAKQIEELVAKINKTNLATALPDGRTLTEALAHRDHLAQLQSALHQIAEAASAQQARYGKAEIRIVRTVEVATLRQRADALAKERRELDTRIQEVNWLTELVA
jgi:hypothetical protein